MLFLTNLTAIAAAAMAVFLIRGHRARPSGASLGAIWSARLVPLVVLLILSTYLVDALRKNIDDSSLRSSVQRVLEEGLRAQPGARVIEVRLTTEGGKRNAFAVVRSPEPLTADMVARLNDKLDSTTGRNILLHVRVVPVHEITRDGPILTPTPSFR